MSANCHPHLSAALPAAAVAVSTMAAGGIVAARAQTAATLPLPLRLSAFAVNMSNIATGRTNVVDIRVTRWTSEEERAALLATMIEKGDKALLSALQKMPDSGRMRIPGWQGPDPHKVVLGWTLRYAWAVPNPEGGHRLLLATDRYVTFWEARENPRTMDYAFTLFEIRLGQTGRARARRRWRPRSASIARRTCSSSRIAGPSRCGCSRSRSSAESKARR